MNKHVILFLLSFLSLSSFSQEKPKTFNYYNKGRQYIGFKIPGVVVGTLGNSTTKFHSFSLDFQYGRFVKDKFMLGSRFSSEFGSYRFHGQTTIFSRYYFLKKRWSPFVELGLQHNYGKVNNSSLLDRQYNYLDAYAAVGLSYQASKAISFELMYTAPKYNIYNSVGMETGFEKKSGIGKVDFRVNIQLNALQNSIRDKRAKKRDYDKDGK